MLQPQILRNIEGSGKYAEEQLDPDVYRVETKRKKNLYGEDKRGFDTC